MNKQPHLSPTEIMAEVEASEDEAGAGVPLAEIEAKIEAAIEQAERAKSIKQE